MAATASEAGAPTSLATKQGTRGSESEDSGDSSERGGRRASKARKGQQGAILGSVPPTAARSGGERKSEVRAKRRWGIASEVMTRLTLIYGSARIDEHLDEERVSMLWGNAAQQSGCMWDNRPADSHRLILEDCFQVLAEDYLREVDAKEGADRSGKARGVPRFVAAVGSGATQQERAHAGTKTGQPVEVSLVPQTRQIYLWGSAHGLAVRMNRHTPGRDVETLAQGLYKLLCEREERKLKCKPDKEEEGQQVMSFSDVYFFPPQPAPSDATVVEGGRDFDWEELNKVMVRLFSEFNSAWVEEKLTESRVTELWNLAYGITKDGPQQEDTQMLLEECFSILVEDFFGGKLLDQEGVQVGGDEIKRTVPKVYLPRNIWENLLYQAGVYAKEWAKHPLSPHWEVPKLTARLCRLLCERHARWLANPGQEASGVVNQGCASAGDELKDFGEDTTVSQAHRGEVEGLDEDSVVGSERLADALVEAQDVGTTSSDMDENGLPYADHAGLIAGEEGRFIPFTRLRHVSKEEALADSMLEERYPFFLQNGWLSGSQGVELRRAASGCKESDGRRRHLWIIAAKRARGYARMLDNTGDSYITCLLAQYDLVLEQDLVNQAAEETRVRAGGPPATGDPSPFRNDLLEAGRDILLGTPSLEERLRARGVVVQQGRRDEIWTQATRRSQLIARVVSGWDELNFLPFLQKQFDDLLDREGVLGMDGSGGSLEMGPGCGQLTTTTSGRRDESSGSMGPTGGSRGQETGKGQPKGREHSRKVGGYSSPGRYRVTQALDSLERASALLSEDAAPPALLPGHQAIFNILPADVRGKVRYSKARSGIARSRDSSPPGGSPGTVSLTRATASPTRDPGSSDFMGMISHRFAGEPFEDRAAIERALTALREMKESTDVSQAKGDTTSARHLLVTFMETVLQRDWAVLWRDSEPEPVIKGYLQDHPHFRKERGVHLARVMREETKLFHQIRFLAAREEVFPLTVAGELDGVVSLARQAEVQSRTEEVAAVEAEWQALELEIGKHQRIYDWQRREAALQLEREQLQALHLARMAQTQAGRAPGDRIQLLASGQPVVNMAVDSGERGLEEEAPLISLTQSLSQVTVSQLLPARSGPMGRLWDISPRKGEQNYDCQADDSSDDDNMAAQQESLEQDRLCTKVLPARGTPSRRLAKQEARLASFERKSGVRPAVRRRGAAGRAQQLAADLKESRDGQLAVVAPAEGVSSGYSSETGLNSVDTIYRIDMASYSSLPEVVSRDPEALEQLLLELGCDYVETPVGFRFPVVRRFIAEIWECLPLAGKQWVVWAMGDDSVHPPEITPELTKRRDLAFSDRVYDLTPVEACRLVGEFHIGMLDEDELFDRPGTPWGGGVDLDSVRAYTHGNTVSPSWRSGPVNCAGLDGVTREEDDLLTPAADDWPTSYIIGLLEHQLDHLHPLYVDPVLHCLGFRVLLAPEMLDLDQPLLLELAQDMAVKYNMLCRPGLGVAPSWTAEQALPLRPSVLALPPPAFLRAAKAGFCGTAANPAPLSPIFPDTQSQQPEEPGVATGRGLAGADERREHGTFRPDSSPTSPGQEVLGLQEQETAALDVVDMDCYESEGGELANKEGLDDDATPTLEEAKFLSDCGDIGIAINWGGDYPPRALLVLLRRYGDPTGWPEDIHSGSEGFEGSAAAERFRNDYVAVCDAEQRKTQMTETGSQGGIQDTQSLRAANLAQLVTEPDISPWGGSDGRPLLAGDYTNPASDKELDLIRSCWSNGVRFCEEGKGIPSQTLLVMMRRYGEPSSWPPQVDRLTDGSIAPLSDIELFRQGYGRWKGLDGPRVAFAEQATGWEAPQQYTTATGGGFNQSLGCGPRRRTAYVRKGWRLRKLTPPTRWNTSQRRYMQAR